jgi:hypothetical protein
VVAVGLTACVPPAAVRVYELPSLPLMVTEVAFAAVTVRVEDAPAAIDAGLAVMVTVGAVFVGVLTFAPHPVNSSGSSRAGSAQKIGREIEWRTRALIKVFSFQSLEGEHANKGRSADSWTAIENSEPSSFHAGPSRLSIPSAGVHAEPQWLLRLTLDFAW